MLNLAALHAAVFKLFAKKEHLGIRPPPPVRVLTRVILTSVTLCGFKVNITVYCEQQDSCRSPIVNEATCVTFYIHGVVGATPNCQSATPIGIDATQGKNEKYKKN